MEISVANLFNVNPPEFVLFLGKKIVLPKQLYYYAAVWDAFEPECHKTYDKALNDFDNNVGSLPDFVNNAEEWFVEAVKPLFTMAVEILSQNGCYSLDEEDFFRKYVNDDFDGIRRIHQEMSNKYFTIREKQEERKREREEERDRKARFEGGDRFGMFLADGIVGMGEKLWDSMKYDDIFTEEIKNNLKQEIWAVCMAIVDDFTFALYNETKQDARNPIPYESMKRGLKIFDKLEKKLVNPEKYREVAIQVFEAYPICDGLLPWCVEQFYDEDGNLQLIAQWLKKEAEVIKVKDEMFKQLYNIHSEKAALKSRADFEKMGAKLAYMPAESKKSLDNAIIKFDREARTIEGIEYKTRDEAAEIAKALRMYDSLLKSNSPKKLEDFPAFEQVVIDAGLTGYAPIKTRLSNVMSCLETQRKKLIDLAESSGTSLEQADKILRMSEKVKAVRIEGMTIFEKNDPLAQQAKQDYNIDADDFVFVKIMFLSSTGIVLTFEGIYFHFLPSKYELLKPFFTPWKTIILLLLSFTMCGTPLILYLIYVIYSLKKSGFSDKMQYYKDVAPFIPWSDVVPANSSDVELLGINRTSTLYLPGEMKNSKTQLLNLLTALKKIRCE